MDLPPSSAIANRFQGTDKISETEPDGLKTPTPQSPGKIMDRGETAEDGEATPTPKLRKAQPAREAIPPQQPGRMEPPVPFTGKSKDAAPLTKAHFSCYHFHKIFYRCRNFEHAVPCMTCLEIDQHRRWRCVFCHLRICDGCFHKLRKCKGRSLEELME